MIKNLIICCFLTTTATIIAAQNTINDIDGNVYGTVTIGNQTWMTENLKTTKYNDGTNIQNVTNSYVWTELQAGAYCWYNNSIGNKAIYGALYNWYAVETGNLCPVGWHVPSNAEWAVLINYLLNHGYSSGDVGKALKAITLWYNSGNGTNASGFTAYGGGWRNGYDHNGYFVNLQLIGLWWSSTEKDSNHAYSRRLYWNTSSIFLHTFNKTDGFSVRCLQD